MRRRIQCPIPLSDSGVGYRVRQQPRTEDDVKNLNRPVISRRRILGTLGAAAASVPFTAYAQGRCMLTFGTPACNTSDIAPVFEPTGWKTIALDHLVFQVADYQKEAAFYIALMGWTLRSDD